MAQDSFLLQLEAGTHWICTCGQSKNAPYCDGSHKGSSFQPLALELQTPSTVEVSGSANVKSS